MTRVGKTTLTCPNCHHDFETHALYSSHSFERTSEFRDVPMGEPPEPYFVHTCPACGLSGWDGVFDDGVSAETSALIAERLTPLMGAGDVPAWHRFVYAAQVAEWQHEPDETIGSSTSARPGATGTGRKPPTAGRTTTAATPSRATGARSRATGWSATSGPTSRT